MGKALKTEHFSELLNIIHYQGQIKRVGPTVFRKQERRYKYLVIGRDRSYIVKKKTL